MAGSQSFASRRVSPSRPIRRFTVAQANSTLPLVKRVVADIVAEATAAMQLQVDLEKAADLRKQADLQCDLEAKSARMARLIEELTVIGVELKDPSQGLIDFIGRHQGRDVYLCWKLGEDQIGFWHDLQAGLAGRKPISTIQETE